MANTTTAATKKVGTPSDVSTTIVNKNGACSCAGVHVAKNGKVKIFSPNFTCSVSLSPANLLKNPPAFPAQITQGQHRTFDMGNSAGTITVTITGGPCQSSLAPATTMMERSTSTTDPGPMASPNQIIIDS